MGLDAIFHLFQLFIVKFIYPHRLPPFGMVLLKVWYGMVQNGYKIIRSDYGSIYLLNGSVRLRVTVHANMIRLITIL